MSRILKEALDKLNKLYEAKQDQEKFKAWIYQKLIDNKFSTYPSDLNKKVDQLYGEFINNKSSFKSPQNDIYYWMKTNDFDKFQDLLFDTKARANLRQKANEGARLVYKDKDWQVYEITNYEASKKYGANTKWCIAGSKRWNNGENGQTYWNEYYNKNHIKFYFFIRSNSEKYALAIYPDNKHFEIYNSEDVKVSSIPNAPTIEEINVRYTTKNNDKAIIVDSIVNNKLPLDVFNKLLYEICDEDGVYENIQLFDNINSVCDFFESVSKNAGLNLGEYLEYQYISSNWTDTAYSGNYPNLEVEQEAKNYAQRFGINPIKDYWDGDVPPIPEEFVGNCKNIKDIKQQLEKVSSKYLYFLYYIDVDGFVNFSKLKDFTDVLMSLNYIMDTDDLDEEDFEEEIIGDKFAFIMTNQLIDDCRCGKIDKNILKQLGCSQEYIDTL